MRRALVLGLLSTVIGCAKAGAVPPPSHAGGGAAATSTAATDAALATGGDGARPGAEPADRPREGGPWIGAAAEGDVLATSTRDTLLGVWVDVPEGGSEKRPPMDLALLVDTSGSMAGDKLTSARAAASMLVHNLHDGDIVALDTFDDHAHALIPPTRIDAETRGAILQRIARLSVAGSTNMFEGLGLAENHVAAAPPSHALRRVVVVSDGIANVGPSSPAALAAVAERGLSFGAQITSLGVGTDYDERTLNALAMRTTGRLYHIGDPREMAGILDGELKLLDATRANDAFIEVVPAPGVQLVGVEGARFDFAGSGSFRIPLGALHAGQHREALVKVRIVDPGSFEARSRPLASVRLRFRDASDGDVERIQEVVARTQLSDDADAIAEGASSRTKAIAALVDASKTELEAAQRINEGQFVDADEELAKAERKLVAEAQAVAAPAEKKRLEVAAHHVAHARAATRAMPAKPKAAQRDEALKLNAGAMQQMGF